MLIYQTQENRHIRHKPIGKQTPSLFLLMALTFSYAYEIPKQQKTPGKQKDAFCNVRALSLFFLI